MGLSYKSTRSLLVSPGQKTLVIDSVKIPFNLVIPGFPGQVSRSRLALMLKMTRQGDRLQGERIVRKEAGKGFAGTRSGTAGTEQIAGVSFDTMKGPETWLRAMKEPQFIAIDDAKGNPLYKFGPSTNQSATVVIGEPPRQRLSAVVGLERIAADDAIMTCRIGLRELIGIEPTTS